MTETGGDGDGELYVLALLDELRAEAASLRDQVTESSHRLERLARTLANPNLPNVPVGLQYALEQWDRRGQHIRWTIALSGSVMVANGAFDAAVKHYPSERWTLRNGIRVLREYEPGASERR